MSVKIELKEVAKRYRLEWVLRNVTLSVGAGQRWALTGPNGSGKSTLMRILSGHLTPSRGKVHFLQEDRPIDSADLYRRLTFAAPYIDLIEEFTLQEAVDFHRRFKPLQAGLDSNGLIDLLDLRRARHKPIRHFSSGMKQRLKLALAIASQSDLLLLDEPTTNLDTQGIGWYLQLIDQFGAGRTIVVASNVEADYQFCNHAVNTMDYK